MRAGLTLLSLEAAYQGGFLAFLAFWLVLALLDMAWATRSPNTYPFFRRTR